MKKMVKLSVVAAVAMTSSAFAASDLAGAFKEGTTSGYVRTMYIGQNNKGTTADVNSLGLGGKLGFVTGSLSGFKAGATFFTTNAINQPNDVAAKTEDYMFNRDSKGYNILGEAYIQYDMGKTTVKVGRQQLDTPLAGSDDVRIIPNMFEAYTVINTDVADTTIVASHVTKMSGLDTLNTAKQYSQFMSMSDAAGLKGFVGQKGVTVTGATYSGLKDTTVQLWNYYGYDMLNATYGDVTFSPKVTSDVTLTLAAQASKTSDMGKMSKSTPYTTLSTALSNRTVDNISYEVYGAKAAVASESTGLTATVAYNKVTGNDKTVTVFGAWGGYPEYAVGEEFWMNSAAGAGASMAKSSVMRGAIDLNLGAFGMGDRVITLAQSKFDFSAALTADKDVTVSDLIYMCKPTKSLAVRAVYEKRESKDAVNDNSRFKVSATYSF